jgi:hypothetical protein
VQDRTIGGQTLADGLGMPPGTLALTGAAALSEHGVEVIEARRHRHRRHEIGAGIFDQALNFPLVIALARPAKAVGK